MKLAPLSPASWLSELKKAQVRVLLNLPLPYCRICKLKLIIKRICAQRKLRPLGRYTYYQQISPKDDSSSKFVNVQKEKSPVVVKPLNLSKINEVAESPSSNKSKSPDKKHSDDPHYIIAFYKAIIEELTIKDKIDDVFIGTDKSTMEDFKKEFITLKNENKMLTSQLNYLKDTLQLKEETKDAVHRVISNDYEGRNKKLDSSDSLHSARISFKSPNRRKQSEDFYNPMLPIIICQSMIIEEQLAMHAKKKTLTYFND